MNKVNKVNNVIKLNKNIRKKYILFIYLFTFLVYAGDYFDPASLSIDGEEIADLSLLENFSAPGGQLPGDYYVVVSVNRINVARQNIKFISQEQEGLKKLFPVLTKQDLIDWGVKVDEIPSLKDLQKTAEIININKFIEFATTNFNFTTQELEINIPQIYVEQNRASRVDPAYWEDGINAIFVNYSISGTKSFTRSGGTSSNSFVNLRSGLNLGAWRFFNYSTYSGGDDSLSQWKSLHTYAQRTIAPLNSQLEVGEISSDSEVMDSFSFRGVKISSDASMLPANEQGFAPIVRGFANSNSTVTIRQNDTIIYQTYVSSGPFEISDLYPTNYSGNLMVTVTEDDGSEHSFVVPFSAVSIMQREGKYKYSASFGKFYSNGVKNPIVAEANIIYGLPWNTTVFTGFIFSKNYQAGDIGFGMNLMGLGALSFDVTQSNVKFDEKYDQPSIKGQSYRMQYSKSMAQTGTTITLAAYRFSTKNFYELNDAYSDTLYENLVSNKRVNKKSRFQTTINQSLGDYGSFYLTAYQQDYWNKEGAEKSYGIGYNGNILGISYAISYNYSKVPNEDKYEQLNLSMNIPLSSNSFLSSNYSNDLSGNNIVTNSLSGNVDDSSLYYSISENTSKSKGQNYVNGFSTSVGYDANAAKLNFGYSYSKYTQTLSYGMSGGAVLTSYGPAFASSLGSTMAFIVAPGAVGATAGNSSVGVFGTAIQSSITPYAFNNITLGVENMASNAEILVNDVKVVPTTGAVVLAKFKTRIGYRALLHLHRPLNEIIPFASVISIPEQGDIGIVGEDGEAYISGLSESGEFKVSWGSKEDQSCNVKYKLPVDEERDDVILIASAICE